MTTLISAEWYKIIRSKAFALILLGVAVTAILGINGNISREDVTNLTEMGAEELAESGFLLGQTGVHLISLSSMLQILWMIAFIGFFVANEFQNGTMRNVLALGKSRTYVFCSKVFSTCVAVTAMLVIIGFTGTIGATLAFGFGDMPFSEYLRYLSVYMLMQIFLHFVVASAFCAIAFISRSVGLSIMLSLGYYIGTVVFTAFCGQFKDLSFIQGFFPYGYIYTISEYASRPGMITKSLLVGAIHIAVVCVIGCAAFKKADIS